MTKRPGTDEYASYYENYVRQVPEGDILEQLKGNFEPMITYWSSLSEEQALYRYGADKWSLKEVLGHIVDTEAIMSYRLLRIARGDTTQLAGFDQDPYIPTAMFDSVPLPDLIERYESTRRSTLSLLRTLPEEAWSRRGNANGKDVTVNALAYIIAGHELHHMNVIKERYTLSGLTSE
ncbi:DinB family protein [Paenibacillus sp. LHD-117]|uniref:DinB family protein n=1 Tax=Paenibacillus sp. LHD-117 TaxID=3071412 RepID=UPI0027E206C3|nr:DinB family protein [Paenibacillus sp. LHD-117]MDQ6420583.1 DinB family protein [Paenibacillus sp. LHD-117]